MNEIFSEENHQTVAIAKHQQQQQCLPIKTLQQSVWARLNVYLNINDNDAFVVIPKTKRLYLMFTICFYFFFCADDDSKNTCAQYLVTNDTNTATLGDLSHIINLETETICIKFESATGMFWYYFHAPFYY